MQRFLFQTLLLLGIPSIRNVTGREYEEITYGQIRQEFIDASYKAHFHSIENLVKVVKECQKQYDIVDDPKLKKRYETLMKSAQKDLLKTRWMTPQVLKNFELMQKDLDSLK